MVAIVVVVCLLWDTRLVYPLKILVVFFHELSHGLAAIVTGGSIDHIELVPQQGGVCYTIGGNRFVVASAGYLGSLLWGGLILLLASKTEFSKYIAILLGLMIVTIGLLFLRPYWSFGFAFTMTIGIALAVVGKAYSKDVSAVILRVIGLTSCLYAPLDIKSDVLDRPGLQSDAVAIAELTHIPSVVWGLIWIGIAVVASGFFILSASKRSAKTSEPRAQ